MYVFFLCDLIRSKCCDIGFHYSILTEHVQARVVFKINVYMFVIVL